MAEADESAVLFDALKPTSEVIRLDQIVDRQTYGATSPAQVAIRRLGNLGGIIVQATPSGGYALVDGRRRVAALEGQGVTEAAVTVLPVDADPNAVALATLAKNAGRPNPIHEGEMILELIEAGLSVKDIAATTGWSEGTINNRLSLMGAPGWAFDFAKEGRIAPSMLAQLARLSNAHIDRLKTVAHERDAAGKKRVLAAADLKEARTAATREAIDALPDALFAPVLPLDTDPDATSDPARERLRYDFVRAAARMVAEGFTPGEVQALVDQAVTS